MQLEVVAANLVLENGLGVACLSFCVHALSNAVDLDSNI